MALTPNIEEDAETQRFKGGVRRLLWKLVKNVSS